MLTPGKDKGIANPYPLGYACLGIATFLTGFAILFQARTSWMPYFAEVIVIGGVAEFLAGMWGFAYGDTVAATVFSYVGAVYAWLGLVYTPRLAAFGALSSDAVVRSGSMVSVGMVLLVSGAIVACFWIASFAQSATLNGSLLFLWLAWALAGISTFGPFHLVTLAAGAAALLSGIIAIYSSLAEVFNEACRREVMPVGVVPSVRDRAENEEYERIRRLHPELVQTSGTATSGTVRGDLHA